MTLCEAGKKPLGISTRKFTHFHSLWALDDDFKTGRTSMREGEECELWCKCTPEVTSAFKTSFSSQNLQTCCQNRCHVITAH